MLKYGFVIIDFPILKDSMVNFIYYGFFTAILRYGVNFEPKTLNMLILIEYFHVLLQIRVS